MAEILKVINRTIPQGLVPTQVIILPQQYNHIILRMTREDWPPNGCFIGIGVSNGGEKWKWFDNFIAAFEPTPKQPLVTDAIIEYAWNPIFVDNRADRVMIRTNSTVSFTSTMTVEAYTRG